MGGRGAEYKVIGRLKNYKNARIFKAKLYDYALNPNVSKSKALYAVGYDRQHYKQLENDIREKLAKTKALQYNKDKRGNTQFQVNMSLGITSKRVFTTAWTIEKGERNPKFVTIYPNKTPYFRRRGKINNEKWYNA